MTDENPFKAALENSERNQNERVRFKPDGRNNIQEQQTRTVADLGLVDPGTLERMPKVGELTVRDLNDLAAEFSGVKTNNTQVAELSLEDLQNIEEVFFDFKVAAGRDLSRTLARGGTVGDLAAAVDVSCCCCTPCCCCAATDMSHTA
jgi:hypothetical protein